MNHSSDHTEAQAGSTPKPVRVVGVGASAGGLEALEEFFQALPADTGMAFVVIQHLSPDFKSHMEELLARRTTMAIHRVENGMAVEPNSLYLIPAKMEMVISDGRLLLTEKDVQKTVSHPIDQFFRSLAADAGSRSVGIVLSGTGSDGSRGIRDIHDAGGMVMAQDDRSAKFDGMPLNAVATGIVDVVRSPSQLAKILVQSVQSGRSALIDELDDSPPKDDIDRIFHCLNEQHGIDFSVYKGTTVGRRIQRRVDLLGLPSLDAYIELLESESDEVNELYKDLLIGVTKFFRDPDAFEVMARDVIPDLFQRASDSSMIRIWVAGCASGEEAYSIAMLMDEERRRRQSSIEVKIFATDIHTGSLQAATRGVFPEEALSELTQQRRNRYFRKHRDGYHVTRELRKYIVFAPHNVVSDAPFTQMDLVTCRNLLIYLQPAAQKKALSLFHFSLRTGGILWLGPSESAGELSDEFRELDKRWRIFSKRRDVRLPLDSRLPIGQIADRLPRAAFSGSFRPTTKIDPELVQTYDRLLTKFMPPSILVSETFEVLHIFSGGERFLQPRSGRPSHSLLDQVEDQLRSTLAGAMQHAMRKRDAVRYTGVRVHGVSDESEVIDVTVEPVAVGQDAVNLLVQFHSTTSQPESKPTESIDMDEMTRRRVEDLEAELRFSQENLQATIEEMETSNEELQASNEELVASNEELQSTNEELHSVNEELYTVNAEHQRRVEELAEANADMDHLLATTRVGVIFLDEDFNIRRFTPEISRIFQLVPHDLGRSFENFSHHLRHEQLLDDLRRVIDERREFEFEVEDRNGVPYILRALPYQTGEQVDGVVVTLIDIRTLKEAKRDLERFKYMTEFAVDPIALIDRDGRFVYVNPAMAQTLGYHANELVEMTVPDIDTVYDLAAFQKAFDQATSRESNVVVTEWIRSNKTRFPVEISINGVEFDGRKYLCAFARDITDRRHAELEMRLQHLAIESALNGIIITDPTADDNPITYANPGFSKLTGYPHQEVIGRNCRFLQGEGTDQNTIAEVRRAINAGRPIRVTIRNYRKDGTPFWNDLQITPVHDEHGRLVNFVGVQHDVTEQVESRAAATSQSERMTAILDTAAEGIYGVDSNGKCTFCNSSALEMLGYGEEEVIGKNLHNLIHHSLPDRKPLKQENCQIYRAFREKKTAHVSDEVFWRKDGSCFPVEYWSRPFVHDGIVHGAVVSFQDITERLTLSSRLEQMGKMIDWSHDAIMAWELNGTILSWNTGATQLYGYSAEEAIGRNTHELLSTVHPRPWAEIYQSLLRTGEWVGILEHTTQSGDKITVSSRHQLLHLPDGSEQVLEINRDITEQMRIQEELERANQAAKEASEAKSEFLANISHELRTPMTAVLGFADILRLESDAPEHLERVDTIKRNGEYLLALLNDILDLSKIEAGKMNIKREVVETLQVIDDVRSLMSIRASDEGIPLYFDWNSEVPREITTDPIRLRQILVNLIGNAIKFTNEGEVRVGVEVKGEGRDAKLSIAVSDTGIGMTPRQQDQLFTPFSQPSQKADPQFGGTGLGLTISKRLAEGLGGTITVKSERGKGSCFTLSLPLKPSQLEEMVAGRQVTEADGDDGDSSSELPRFDARILLADDRRDVWRIGKYFLEKCGATVTVVEDGKQAVEAVAEAESKDEPFELVLMDMQMPVMNGREAVAELRERGFDAPIIALTADAMVGEREACLKIGCDDYFPKPIHGAKLMKLVAKRLKR